MPRWLPRILWMALQGAIIVLVMVVAHYAATDRGEEPRPGIAFMLGCGAAIIVTTLLTKGWDLSRAAVALLRRATVGKRQDTGGERLDVLRSGVRPSEGTQIRHRPRVEE